jgi:hypothetical protein
MEEYTYEGQVIDPSKLLFTPTIEFPKQNYNITFHRAGDNGFVAQEIGRLDFNGPTMKFDGDLEESAKVFFEWVAKAFEGRLKEEYRRGYEDCLTEEAKK